MKQKSDLTGLAFCTDYDAVHSVSELKTAVQINMVVAYDGGNIDEEKMDSHSRDT